jgi:ABC-type sugar transport system ATPase subunit
MMADGGDAVIETRGLKKNFGTVEALTGVDISLRENEVLGLVGDNGAGKSTLVKTLVGLHQPTDGEILFKGDPVTIDGPKEARKLGISTVYQDLALVDELSVAENMFLGRLPTKRLAGIIPVTDEEAMVSEARRILSERLNIHLNPEAPVEYLSGGERQAVAIGRALVTDPEIVFLDEPTSALSKAASDQVEELVAELRGTGHTVLVIDHNLEEVIAMCDRIAVMFNGQVADVGDPDEVTREQIVATMISGEPVSFDSSQEPAATD